MRHTRFVEGGIGEVQGDCLAVMTYVAVTNVRPDWRSATWRGGSRNTRSINKMVHFGFKTLTLVEAKTIQTPSSGAVTPEHQTN